VVADVEARAVAGDLADFLQAGETILVALGGLPGGAEQVDQLAIDVSGRRRRLLLLLGGFGAD
jgi:hypothetical protein